MHGRLVLAHSVLTIVAACLSACSAPGGNSAGGLLNDPALPEGPRVSFEVRAASSGTAPAADMVLIPGLSSPAPVWDATANRLQDHARVHLAQLAGYAGAEPVRTRDGVLADAEADIIDYLQSCCGAPVVLVGHSLGGTIALAVAHNRPDLVARVVIVDARPSAGGPDNRLLLQRRAAGTRDGVLAASEEAFAAEVRTQASEIFATDPADVERIVQWSLDSHRPTVAQSLFELTLTDQRPLHPGMTTPVTVLAAWHVDRGFAFEDSVAYWEGLYAGLPDADVRLVRDSRHFIMLDQPDRLVAELIALTAP